MSMREPMRGSPVGFAGVAWAGPGTAEVMMRRVVTAQIIEIRRRERAAEKIIKKPSTQGRVSFWMGV
jgi:hypothetical protein